MFIFAGSQTRPIIALAAMLWLMPINGHAFGTLPHIVVLEIALMRIEAEQRDYVIDKLEGINAVGCELRGTQTALWMDTHRLQIPYWSDYHSSNSIFHNPENIDISRQYLPSVDIYTVLNLTQRAIADQRFNEFSLFQQSYLLRVLVHLMGDIHQPLHVVGAYYPVYGRSGATAGGNSVNIAGSDGVNINFSRNLHSLWDNAGDTEPLNMAIDSDNISDERDRLCAKKSIPLIRIARRFTENGNSQKIARQFLEQYQFGKFNIEADLSAILRESSRIGVESGWRPLDHQILGLENRRQAVVISQEYLDKLRAVSAERITTAGLRLAHFLRNNITVPRQAK